jgi:sn1-specific diacylglycerol lipase
VIDGANRLLGFNIATLKQMIGGGGGNPATDYDITFVSFHADVAKTPFFIAIDYRHQSVVLSIRGTISMKDIITDLQAEAEPIQLLTTTNSSSSSRSNSNHQGWFGHKVRKFILL